MGVLITLSIRVRRDWAGRRREALEAHTRRRTEMKGLLRMLLVEIEENERQFRAFRTHPFFITNAPPGCLRWGVCEDTRVRLAQLLEDEEYTLLSGLARCYDMIQQIAAFRLIDRDKLGEQDVIQQIASKLPTAIDRCQTAANHIRKHVPDATGAYLPPSEK